jgi:putative RNA 2'-phosphotransferase
MSTWLRHRPEAAGLTLSPEGWVEIEAVASALAAQGIQADAHAVLCAVHADERDRFEVEGSRVRARYGHTVPLEAGLHPSKPPQVLYYGCPARYVARTLARGLQPMKKQHVHLTPSARQARQSATRRGQEAEVLAVAAHQAFAAGIQFYPRGKGVWLSEPVPPEYLTLVESDADFEESGGAPARGRRRIPRGGFLVKGPRSQREGGGRAPGR